MFHACLASTCLAGGIFLSVFGGVLSFRQESDSSFNIVKFATKDSAAETKLCQLKGQFYIHGDFVPTPDPCRSCVCFRGDVLCWRRECPPPGHMQNCREVRLLSRCCPVYVCPMKNVVVNESTDATDLLPSSYRPDFRECHLDGKTYSPGQIIESATGPCLRCRCGNDGSVICDHTPCMASRLDKERLMKPTVEKPVVNIQKYKLNDVRSKKQKKVED